MISEDQLATWEKLANEATEGPWYAYEGRDYSEIHERTATHARALALVGSKHKDAEFIAMSREAVPALIAEVRRTVALWRFTCAELREKTEQLEKEADWLAEKCATLDGGIADLSANEYREIARKVAQNGKL